MFNLNEYVMHNLYGVLQIIDIEEIEIFGNVQNYYVCTSVFNKSKQNATLKVPVNKCASLSKIISREEADKILEDAKNFSCKWIKLSKKRVSDFQQILLEGDFTKLCALMKLFHEKDVEDQLTAKDKELLAQAEKIVYGQFSIVYEIEYDKVLDFIKQRVNL